MLHILFSLCIVSVFRFVLSAYMLHAYKKKEYTAIQKHAALWDKWFFISATKGIKDRYSKTEKRKIPYSKHARFFQIINILHHCLSLVEVTLWLGYLVFSNVHIKFIAEKMAIVLYCIVGVSFLIFAVITASENREYHKKRVMRK